MSYIPPPPPRHPAGQCELENVQLRVEAFDHLKLPFAIHEGRVGKLRLQVCVGGEAGSSRLLRGGAGLDTQ